MVAGEPRRRLEPLDGLRGILALLVVVWHLPNSFPEVSAFLDAHLPVIRNGSFAVDAFFVMSGFVMMHVYSDSFRDGVARGRYLAFLRARVARLYPVHLATLAVLAAGLLPFIWQTAQFQSHEGRYAWSAAAASALMLHGPWIDHRTWNYPAWSISAEWHAYLLFPFLVASVRGRARSGILIACGVLTPLCLYLWNQGGEAFPTNGPLSLLRTVPLFIAGMAAYNLRGEPWTASPWFAAPTVAALLGCLASGRENPWAVLFIPGLVLAALGNATLSRLLSTRPAVVLGINSYSIYMVHALVQIFLLSRVAGASSTLGLGLPGQCAAVAVAVAVVASVGLGALVRRFIEDPCRKWIVGAGRRMHVVDGAIHDGRQAPGMSR